ncbi:major facilitator superfamily domain-containing protein [Lipomyces arxii]|uniref:major facilitator superfamily domain-containing protein n=1 Tax=Lipomyces arxii TaxID=56418 RepID=UPI0034CF3512
MSLQNSEGAKYQWEGDDIAIPQAVLNDNESTVSKSRDLKTQTDPDVQLTPHQFPEGGTKAWLCVLGAFCSQFCAFGWTNTCGVFQEYYIQNQLKDYSSTAVSWVTLLPTIIMFMGSLVVGRFFDSYGPRWILLVGTVLESVGIMLTSICNSYGPILVCQGIVAPLGTACVYNASMGSVTTYFKRRRSLALGIMSSGSSVGGVIFPILIRRLTVTVGFGWAMRAAGFLILALLIVANLTVTSHVKPRGHYVPLSPAVIVNQFRDSDFVLLGIAFCIIYLGFMLPFTYIVSYAAYKGVNGDTANYLVAFLNAASIFGRIIPAMIADKVGQYNMNSVFITIAGVIVLALWLPATTQATNIVFAVLYGFFSGTFVALIPACVAQISDIHDIGMRVGLMFFLVALPCMIGVPIGGVIIGNAMDEGRWMGMMIFAGVFMILGGIIHWIARVKLVGWSLRAVC